LLGRLALVYYRDQVEEHVRALLLDRRAARELAEAETALTLL